MIINLDDKYINGGGIMVYFEKVNRFDIKILRNRISEFQNNNFDKIYIVLKSYNNAKPLSRLIKPELSKTPNIEILENIYPFNTLNNINLPKFLLLKNEEKEKILEYMNTELNKFPKIKIDDPISIHFGAKKDDMFKIERYGGQEITYKVVN